MTKRTTIRDIRRAADENRKLTMVTAYDAYSARLVDRAGIDMILVGDSVGTTVQGREDTVRVEMSQMLYHTEIVSRVAERALVIGDMPFGSYQVDDDDAMANAIAFLKAGANAVKLEGGGEQCVELVEQMTSAGIPVMGHVGYTPQSVNVTGGPKVNKSAKQLTEDARALVEAGAFSIVLEMVPAEIAREVTESCGAPTIGIGAGPHTSGQVLVYFDMLGFDPSFTPKFLKRYFQFYEGALDALKQFKTEVESGDYPADEHSY